MRNRPSFITLRALEAAVRLGGYSAAARELSITQGAVSQQIRKLEGELGARLFERRGNDMVPTEDAARLAREVAAAIRRLDAAVDAFPAVASGDPLVVSVDSRFASRWLGPKLPRLLAEPAGARLDVRVEDRVANFATDGIDAGVQFGRGDWDGLLVQRLTTECFHVVCSPAFAAAHPISGPKDLLDVPLIHSPEGYWSLLFDTFGLPTPPPTGLVSNNSPLVIDAVTRGVGAALVRASMVEEDLREGRLVRPIPHSVPLPVDFVKPGRLVRPLRRGDPAPPAFGYFLVWRADSDKQDRIAALKTWLLREAAGAPDAATPNSGAKACA